MAYYLAFDGVDDNVTFATPITIPSTNTDGFAYVWDFYYDGTSDQVLFANPASFDDSIRIVSSTQISVRFGNTSRNYTLSTGLTVGRQILKLKKVDGSFSGTLYDSSNNALSPEQNLGDNTIHGFGAESVSSRRFSGDLYSAQIYSDFTETTLVHDWQPSATNGTGTTLEDTAGTNDGTLNNFAGTTDSWWVFYSGGGGLTIITSPIVSGEVVGSPTFTTGTVLIDPVAIATAESVGNPTIAFGVTVLNPTAIASVELVGEPVVVPLGVVLQPVEIVTEEVVGTPVVVTGLVFLIPDSISTEEAVGEPFVDTLLKQIFPTEILSLEDVGRPSVFGGDSIIIPLLSRQTWNAVAKYLRELVFTGYDNDVIMKWLRSEGYEDAYNDNWDDYLLGQGYLTGALADKYAQWRQGVVGDDPWILSEGTWNDNKIWRDNEFWRDS